MWICVGTVGICSVALVTNARKTMVNPTTSRQTISGLLRQRLTLANVRILRQNRIPVLLARISAMCWQSYTLTKPHTHTHKHVKHSHSTEIVVAC
uniref:Putative secreted peptide n=1 Tax=Anopheles braziliensis TaxID=58242 RepID=A0A2M3ZP43_9DIPT